MIISVQTLTAETLWFAFSRAFQRVVLAVAMLAATGLAPCRCVEAIADVQENLIPAPQQTPAMPSPSLSPLPTRVVHSV